MPRTARMDPAVAAAAKAASAKKAEDVSVLDLRGLSDVTDYFLICHGRSTRQAQTISDSIERALLALKRRPKHIEGYARAEWILMDYLDFVVHIFTAERREYYGLERLWSDAPRLSPRRPGGRETQQRQTGTSGSGAASD